MPAQRNETVICRGQPVRLLPQQFWHLVHPTAGLVLNNAFLGEGFCSSMSVICRMPGLEKVGSPYGFKAKVDDKEQTWERVRTSEYPNLPSRCGAFFLFDDRQFAEQLRDRWFPGEDRIIVSVQIVEGSRVHRADAKWLDATPDRWEENARRYWSSEVTTDQRPEVLVDGAVYFPGWRDRPFGLLTPYRP